MQNTAETDYFDALPESYRIPASPVRVVALMRSSNIAHVTLGGGGVRRALAYLVTVYSLRGTYQAYVYLALQDRSGGSLYGGSRAEVAVSRFAALEAAALRWLATLGFEMRPIDLAALDLTGRVAALAPLPFAHHSEIGLDVVPGAQALAASESREALLTSLLGGQQPVDALRKLRDVLIVG